MSEGLFDASKARHPMWTAPDINEPLTGHVRALRKEIARQLRRFDGRTDCNVPVAFIRQVYDATTMTPSDEPMNLLGWVVFLKAQSIHVGRTFIQAGHASEIRRDSAIITRLAECFTEAITKEMLT